VRCPTYSYLPSRRVSPPISRYQIIMFGDRGQKSVNNLPRVITQPRPPFPSNRYHRSNGGQKNYQVCCVQYCVQQLYTVNCTHIWTDLTVLWIEFSHWTHLTVLRFISVYVLFCVWLYIVCMRSVVTWWGGPDGTDETEAWSLGPLLPSGHWHCRLGHLTRKTRHRYDL